MNYEDPLYLGPKLYFSLNVILPEISILNELYDLYRYVGTNYVFHAISSIHFSGTLNEDYLRELLTTLGDRFTQDEVDDLYKEAPIKNGQFDFVEFTRILKHGAKDPDDK